MAQRVRNDLHILSEPNVSGGPAEPLGVRLRGARRPRKENISTSGGNRLNLGRGPEVRIRRKFRPMAAGARHRSFMSVGPLYYKLNNWVTFAFKRSLYETNAAPVPTGTLPLFSGIPARTWCDLRSEGGTIFTF